MKYLLSLAVLFLLVGCSIQPSTDSVTLNSTIEKSNSKLRITNNDIFSYENVEITINGDYVLKPETIRPNNPKVFELTEFAKEDGMRFNIYNMKVLDVQITATVHTNKFGYTSASFK
jgi:hypothetical protein